MTWDWRRVPEDAAELAEQNDLINIGSLASLSQFGETWSWVPDPKGNFSVKSVKNLLHRSSPPIGECCFSWNNWVPRKVNIFGWRMALDRLPTRVALAHCNISMSSICCPFCCDKDESAYHLFAECAVSFIVWQMVSSWINIPPIYAFTIEDLLRVHEHIAGSVIVKKLIQAIVLISCWSLWKSRNDLIFSGTRVDISRLLAEIKSTSFLWVKHRAKMNLLDWADWCSFNIL
ncbi:uncharacterized protein LOC110901295 [Helianthus annuus]|uniref:uncharacterized protein LOC110901295 n=1 Tax=Helianthus annuus TaxID=4232 RepID=UPI000B8F6C03|nr:uncharacterized protein LOC110901295 [Helianthus annuus]